MISLFIRVENFLRKVSISQPDFGEAFVKIPSVLGGWCGKVGLSVVRWLISELLRVQLRFNESQTRTESTKAFNTFPHRQLPFRLLLSVSTQPLLAEVCPLLPF